MADLIQTILHTHTPVATGEEARKAEERRIAEEERKAEEARKAEERRIAEEERKAEIERQEQKSKAAIDELVKNHVTADSSVYKGYKDIPWGIPIEDFLKIYQKTQLDSYQLPNVSLNKLDADILKAFPQLSEIRNYITAIQHDGSTVLSINNRFFGVIKKVDIDLEPKMDAAIRKRFGKLDESKEERIDGFQTRVTHSNSTNYGRVIYSKIYGNLSESAKEGLTKDKMMRNMNVDRSAYNTMPEVRAMIDALWEKVNSRNIEEIYLLTHSTPLFKGAEEDLINKMEQRKAQEEAKEDQAVDDFF